MARHNLGNVVSFEVVRTLTKRTFWITTLVVPLFMAAVFTLIVTSNQATKQSVSAQTSARFDFTYTDASGYVDPAVARAMGGKPAADAEKAIAEVRAGKLDAYFAYPADPAKQPTKVYGVDVAVFENGKYQAVATQVLTLSAQKRVGDPKLAAVLRGESPVEVTTFKAGRATDGVTDVIPPMLFLVVFYVLIVLLGNHMTTSLLEEKENRVSEMILTTVDSTTLVIGKIISLFAVGLVQILAFALPVITGYLFFRQDLNFPTLDLSHLVLDPARMTVGALLLIGGFSLFTAALVAAGALMPTAKDAAQISAPVMILIFAPLWAASIIVSNPGSFVVGVLTYFPFTAPVTSMLRNGFGSLPIAEAAIVIAELAGLSVVAFRLAVRLFRYGSISYTQKVSVRAALRGRD